MKKLYAILIGIAIAFSSCDDFLEIPSETNLSTAIYFKSQSDFEQAINGAYAPLRGLYNGYNGAWAMGEMRSDNTTYIYNTVDRGQIQGEYIKDFVEQSDNAIPLNKWVSNYSIISRVNFILESIDNIEFDKAVKDNIKGQAYFLRALCYLDLVQYFGSVPLHLAPVKSKDEASLPLASISDIYKSIIDDAGQAKNLLPDKATQEPGRPTSGSAIMVLANSYINLKEWNNADEVLKEIKGYKLLPDYASIYDINNKNNEESIFEIQYKAGTDGFNSSFIYTFIPPMTSEEIYDLTGVSQSERTMEAYNVPTPDLIKAYEPNDKRKDASIGYLTAHGATYPYVKKYLHAHNIPGNTGDNWPVYRYAEALLFKAEVANELDRPAEACGYLNDVRERAGLGRTFSSSDKDAIREAIFKERRVELAFENKRWLDLVRSGKAEAVMKSYGENVRANPRDYYFPEGYTIPTQAYQNIPLLFELPAADSALSPYF